MLWACYGLNHVPLKLTCWNSNPQYHRMWLSYGRGGISRGEVKTRLLGWSLRQADWCSYKKRKFGHMRRHQGSWEQKRDHEERQQKDNHLQAKERCFRWNQPYRHFGLGHPALKPVKSRFLYIVPFCYSHPSKLIQTPKASPEERNREWR